MVFFGAWFALLGAEAGATSLLVHTLVVAEPRDGEAGLRAAERVGLVLVGTGAARLIDPLFAEARLGRSPAAALADCAGREACWREVGLAVGAERLVWVERVDRDQLGLVTLEVTGEGGLRRERAALLAGEWPDPRLVERLMLGEGALRVEGLPPRAALRVDGVVQSPAPRGEAVEVRGLHAGKHAVEVDAPGFRPWHAAVLVPPDGERALRVELVPAVEVSSGPPRWWAGVAVGALGGIALGFAARSAGAAGPP